MPPDYYVGRMKERGRTVALRRLLHGGGGIRRLQASEMCTNLHVDLRLYIVAAARHDFEQTGLD